MPVTIEDIAKRAGKSITTVSRALNNYPDVSPETKALVNKIAKELGYSPSSLAQRLQKQRSDTFGLILPIDGRHSADPFCSEFIAGVSRRVAVTGFDLLVSSQPPGDSELLSYQEHVQRRRVDGFIIVRTRLEDARILYLKGKNFPFVCFGRTDGENNFPFIDVDGYNGFRRMTRHLLKLGHKRLACIAAPEIFTFSHHRLRGFKDELAAQQISLQPNLVVAGDLSQGSGYAQAQKLLSIPEPPTAILAANDLMALGAISAAQERGYTVGKDLAITGFDDIPMAEHSHPRLSTIRQPIYDIGSQTCDVLIQTIQERPSAPQQRLLVPELVIRESCGAQ